MTKLFVLLLTCTALFAAPAGAEIYKWVDNQGVVHYSDKPVDGAQPADLPQLQGADSTTLPDDSAAPAPDESSPGANGLSVTLQRPQPQETFRGTGAVPLQAAVSPQLAVGQNLVYYLDGNPAAQPTRNTSLQLSGLARGEHTASVAVVDDTGNSVAHSPSVTFYVKTPSAITPLNKSAPRSDAQQPAGAATAPATQSTQGTPAAPRFNTGAPQP